MEDLMTFARFLAVALLLPGSAFAGVGVSYSPALVNYRVVHGGNDPFNLGFLAGGDPTVLPSIDLRLDQATFQFYALDLLSNLIEGDVLVGVDGYYHAVASEMPGKGTIVFQPGGQLDVGSFDNSGFYLGLAVAARCGVEVGPERSGLGVYVIPDIGVVLPADHADAEAEVGGAVGFSVWY
jgi:hypothetical protein